MDNLKIIFEKDFNPAEIKISPRPVWKCRNCVEYNLNPSCPPYAPDWREAEKFIKSYKKARIYKFGVDIKYYKESKKKIERYLIEVEKQNFRKYNYVYAIYPGSCNYCDKCTFDMAIGRCKNFQYVRPSINAIGIEISSIVDIDFNEQVLYGIILFE